MYSHSHPRYTRHHLRYYHASYTMERPIASSLCHHKKSNTAPLPPSLTQTPFIPTLPRISPPSELEGCPTVCFDYSCDDWEQGFTGGSLLTCAETESWGCDCSGCACDGVRKSLSLTCSHQHIPPHLRVSFLTQAHPIVSSYKYARTNPRHPFTSTFPQLRSRATRSRVAPDTRSRTTPRPSIAPAPHASWAPTKAPAAMVRPTAFGL